MFGLTNFKINDRYNLSNKKGGIMPKVGLYTIYDRIAQEAGPVFNAKNDQVAVRNAVALLKSVSDTQIDDYLLYRVGTFDTDINHIDDCEKKIIDYEFQFLVDSDKSSEVDANIRDFMDKTGGV